MKTTLSSDTKTPRRFGLLIIGDEILSGKRRDAHLTKAIELLAEHGQEVAYAHYLSDDRALIVETLKRTFASGDVVFSFGGIGATPDDHTRQSAAEALGVPIERHVDAASEINARFGVAVTETRLVMADFPAGANIIPNAYNRIPAFSCGEHYFLPGFPEMSWPMMAWVLRQHYADLPHTKPQAESTITIEGAGESDLLPMMQTIVRDYPLAKLSSLPRYENSAVNGRVIEFSLRGDAAQVANGLKYAKDTITAMGYPVR